MPALQSHLDSQGEGVSKITESARGEFCQIRIPGACRHTPDTVVWAHGNGSAAGKGIGQKSHDLIGTYACVACHDLYDRRRTRNDQGQIIERWQVELAFWEGHARSVCILIAKGLVVQARGVLEVAA